MIFQNIKNRLIAARLFYIFVLFYLFLFAGSTLFSQTTQSYDSTNIDRAEITKLIKEFSEINEVIIHTKSAVKAFTDSSFLPDLLFQLSELELRREKLGFELNMIKFDLKSNLFEKGKIKQMPEQPDLNYEQTLNTNRKILQNYPNVPFYNNVLYRNAICMFETGKRDSAVQVFHQLIRTESDNTVLSELIFRLGECYFDEANYELALKTYQQILKSWDSHFFAMALYKIAWCQYKMNNIPDAISTFYYLLNDIKLLKKIDTELLGKSQIDLQREVIDYIAISFCDFGGVQALLKFINKMGETEYTPDFLFKMGEIYLKRSFYSDAIEAYAQLLKNFRSFKNMPTVFLNLFDCYEKNGALKKTLTLHDQCILKCGLGSQWQVVNNTSGDKELFDNTLKQLKYKTSTPFLTSADSSFVPQNYKMAAKKYAKFLKVFPTDKRTEHAQYCLGECFFGLGKYTSAAKIYEMFVQKFPESELKEDAAYNYIVCYDKILNYSNILLEKKGLKLELDQDSENLIAACKNYLDWLPNSEKVPEIKLKLAEIFYRLEQYNLGEKYAKSALKTMLKTKANEHQKTDAINLLAQIKFKQEKYIAAKKWYTVLMLQNPDSTELVEKSKKMMASSEFKIGELLIKNGKYQHAALIFERTAQNTTDPQIAQHSLFEAGIQFEKIGKLQKAALNYESLYKKYPWSDQAKKAIYRAGVLREKLEQFHLAASNYLELNKLLPESQKGASALFNAGLAYEKAKDWNSAAKTFTRYLNEFPDENERVLEVIFKVAFAHEQKNSTVKANLWYQKLLNKYDQLTACGKFADEYFAARATFRLGEMKNTQFQAVKLKPPLQYSLKRKQKVFNDLMKLYVKVTEFNIAEWTTAAFYRIGLAYEQFCQDIFNSPSPSNLNKQQQNTY